MNNPSTVPLLMEGRRQQILDGADAYFTLHGFRPTTMSQATADCGASEEEIFSVFASLDLLTEAVVDRRHLVWMGRVQDCCDKFDASHDKVLSIFGFLERWFAEEAYKTTVFSTVYTSLGIDNPWVLQMAARHVKAFTTMVEDLAVSGGLPRSLGTSIAILAEGAQVTAALTTDPSPAREARTAAAMLIAVYQTDLDVIHF
ncbi:TetR/AcrR family transcriptional regulator [Frondihabitans sp. PhB188]|uniref:TetR/AcrR family transcriptional regulator n=1 Tax=Frondihabitans sp. PhB188 TaxID=2485200 RepID=UPI0011CEB1DF|nr:TetR/AcrR family transcriptional regulator [Frondihabitans sp. PhB188]